MNKLLEVIRSFPYNFAPLTRVREQLGGTRKQQDDAIYAAIAAGTVGVIALEGRDGNTEDELRSSLPDVNGGRVGYLCERT